MEPLTVSAPANDVVVTIGELVVDWIAMQKGANWGDSETFLRSAGGNAANVAYALSRLGTKSRLVAKVGDDLHAAYLLDSLNGAGVDTTFVSTTANYATAQCYVLTDSRDENLFFNWPRPNACHQLTEADLAVQIFEQAMALHATGISLTVEPRSSAVIEAMKQARTAGLFVSFDAGFPTGEGENARRLAADAMQLAHMIKVNLPELFYWLEQKETDDLEELKALGHTLQAKTDAIILLTLGARGSIIIDGSRDFYAAPVKVESLAGVGAGDAYVAAVLNQLAVEVNRRQIDWSVAIKTVNWHRIANFANAAGALATRTVSASQGLPTSDEVRELLESNDSN